MNTNQIALSSLALDLKRVALGYHRGSIAMADRFLKEACKRADEADISLLKPYIQRVLKKISLLNTDKTRIAEDAQMLSTLVQNYSITYLS